MHDNVKAIDALHTCQAGMNSPDNSRLTPLHYAAKHGYEETVGTLISYRASIWARDICGKKAIDLAKNNNIRKLLEEAEKEEIERARTYGVTIESEEPNTALDTIEGQIVNNLTHMQLEPSTALYEERVTSLVNSIACIQLKPNEIRCLANNLARSENPYRTRYGGRTNITSRTDEKYTLVSFFLKVIESSKFQCTVLKCYV
ncbi:MAG: ankyrin repeat domain-containing protein [Wolbachia sp.]